MEDSTILSDYAKYAINNPKNRIVVSVITFYELAIKINIGKILLSKSLNEFYADTLSNNIEILPIQQFHLNKFIELPKFDTHKDPFDRLIIATAIAENATLLSADGNFRLYENYVNVAWKEL
jgi:PIN domain nuclease of toxin-antitoxin system